MKTGNDIAFGRAEVAGPLDTKPDDQPDTLAHYICQLVRHNPCGHFVEVGVEGEEKEKSNSDLFDEALRLARKIDHLNPKPDQFVILCFENAMNYVPAAWACFLNGYSVLPLSISSFFRNREVFAQKVEQLTGGHGTFLVLTEARFKETFELICARGAGIVVMDSRLEIAGSPSAEGVPNLPSVEASSSILIETSGTTGTPKLARIGGPELINRFFSGMDHRGIVNLALLGQNTIGGIRLLLPVGDMSIYMDPGKMMADTGAWLDLVSRHGVTHIGLSNSMAAKINDWFSEHDRVWDLSSLKKLFFGSEMIVADNIRKLINSFEDCGMTDATASLVYSMTETGPLFITTVPARELYTRSKMHAGYFNLDQCFTSWSVRIVDEGGRVVVPGEIGSIQAFSETRMFRGYHPGGDGFLEDGWFDTGDLGSLNEAGLVLTGRKKSILNINARKISTEAVELAMSEVDGIKPGLLAAAPYRDEHSQTDELAVFFTPISHDAQDRAELADRITAAVSRSIGVRINHLVPIREDQFVRTPSGKIKKDRLCDALRSGALVADGPNAGKSIAASRDGHWIQRRWQQVLKLAELPDENSNFFKDGGDSLASIELLISTENHFQCRIPPEAFYKNPTLGNLTHLAEHAISQTRSPTTAAQADNDVLLILRQMEALTATWKGARLIPDSLVVGLNVSGTKAPIFWVFQQFHEFEALAANLGPDQPVYGIRSLVGLVATADYSQRVLKPLCKQITLEILAVCPTGHFFVGGNCQGAIVALHLARELRLANRRPDLLILMEWAFSHGRYDDPTLFLYGRDSHTKAIFAAESKGEPYWRADFPVSSAEEINGGHGTFFRAENAPILARKLEKHIGMPTASQASFSSFLRRVSRGVLFLKRQSLLGKRKH